MDLRTFSQIHSDDLSLVGGKALSLAQMTAAGLPVPPGFCVTTMAHLRLRDSSLGSDQGLVAEIAQQLERLGEGPLAVRSSAIGEDGQITSFAGQQDTILGVTGLEATQRAIEQCWASLTSERAAAYRRQQGVRNDQLAMAVVVQRLVPAEAAGVLFTRDPLDPTGRQMLVEASWGLGETVVSGRVTPDRFHLDRETGKLLDRHVSAKLLQRTARGEEPVPLERQAVACLDESQLARLAELGRFVEAYHREARDIEWAYAEGQFWLLQSRPITAGGLAERESVRAEEIAALRAKAAPGGTVWSRFNLAEVLPAPTPLTWAVVSRHLMAGQGGFGRMYRDLGFDPDPALDEVGIFDLVCGRPYCNLSREAKLHYRRVPFDHSFAVLKADPRRALYPTPMINPTGFPWHFWLTLPVSLPVVAWQMLASAVRRQRLVPRFAERFRSEIVPPFLEATRTAGVVSLGDLDDAGLVRFFEEWTRRTLVEFARESLKPTALAALCLAHLEQKLGEVLGPSDAAGLTRDLVMGVKPPAEADLAGGIRGLVEGRLSREEFLTRFGHRGSEEMELAQPRWSEDASHLAQASELPSIAHKALSAEERLKQEPRLNGEQRDLVLREVALLHDYLGLREAGKHYLLLGYAQMRRALVELDRRHRLDGGLFYLTPDEFPALLRGDDLTSRIAERRRRRTLALGLEVPPVLFSDDLEVIGRPAVLPGAEIIQGVPLSAGVAEAPALVLEHPHATGTPPAEYILVCPTTDPAWVPLFVRARGLVMETGGVLSHGAIVAREFGLPAVAGLPGILRRVRTGQRLRIDGSAGTVALVD
ncbi:MAG: PEP/pyruvate-binding domain-containing protein [Gemmataceae bacterium]